MLPKTPLKNGSLKSTASKCSKVYRTKMRPGTMSENTTSTERSPKTSYENAAQNTVEKRFRDKQNRKYIQKSTA